MIIPNSTIRVKCDDLKCTIRIHDFDSDEEIAKVELSHADYLSMQAGGEMACSAEVSDKINILGKKLESGIHEFQIPFGVQSAMDNLEEVKRLANASMPEGWTPDHEYNNKSFYTKDGLPHAKVYISRWT